MTDQIGGLLIRYLLPIVCLGLACSTDSGRHCPGADELKTDATGSISWHEATAVLLGCELAEVQQSHDLEVRVLLQDGRTYTTTEPAMDAAFNLLEDHGLQEGVMFTTE